MEDQYLELTIGDLQLSVDRWPYFNFIPSGQNQGSYVSNGRGIYC